MAEKILWNQDWEFAECPLEEQYETMPSGKWRNVTLPHDWLIEDISDLYRDSIGWYRKAFVLHPEKNREYLLRFDGVYMDSTVYVNGRKVKEWKYGYSTFEADLTPYLVDGENEVAVRAVNRYLNTRWYSGAGIYRNVWWKERYRNHMVSDGVYITPVKERDGVWRVEIGTELALEKTEDVGKFRLKQTIYAPDGTEAAKDVLCVQGEYSEQNLTILKPALWDIGQGNLYRLVTDLYFEDELLETEEQRFGFRTIEFSPKQGFLLNGRYVKIKGVCEHHDFGCLGAVFYRDAMRRKFIKLRAMGVNALRTSHNMPAPEVMELADEMGFLIDAEAFDMWEKSKTPYDYGRFFKEWHATDVESWIRRDRNHPCVMMWSIGNEIPDTVESAHGQEITADLIKEVRKHDPKHHAPVTLGSNFMKWDHAKACGELLDLVGYNYSEYLYEEHHREHPDWIIYGSETASVLASRGIYHFPKSQHILTEEDEQCSALGNSITGWGAASYESCICDDRDAAFSLGQFLWTGFDYIGESTPYQTKNSYFGQLDTAGFPKDSYYIFQAEWTDYRIAPMVHLFPYWDFNPGQMIDVQVCSNAPMVELWVNGISMGKKRIDHTHGRELLYSYRVAYEPGSIEAAAYDEEGNMIAREVRHSFKDAVRIHAEVENLPDTDDNTSSLCLEFIKITVLDKEGFPVENANQRIFASMEGAGRILGMDSGDSTDFESYRENHKRLFSGKLLAVVERRKGEECLIRFSSPGLQGCQLEFPAEGSPKNREILLTENDFSDLPVRKIELSAEGSCHLTPDNPKVFVRMKLFPELLSHQDDFREKVLDKLEWKVVNTAGIQSTGAKIERAENGFYVSACHNGEFRLRVLCRNGKRNADVMSHLEMEAEGFGEGALCPYQEVFTALSTDRNPQAVEGIEHGLNCLGEKGKHAVFGFDRMDFGLIGTEMITVSIFANTDDPVSLRIWDGYPDREGSSLLIDGIYHKPHEWMVFQPKTYCLPGRLTGVHSLYFETPDSFQFKSFIFKEILKAYEKLCVADCDRIYGDCYTRTSSAVENIGNNVSIVFDNLDFGEKHANRIRIKGRTDLSMQPIQIRWTMDRDILDDLSKGQMVQMIEFTGASEYTARVYELEPLYGRGMLEFIFLPGSSFDFMEFQLLN